MGKWLALEPLVTTRVAAHCPAYIALFGSSPSLYHLIPGPRWPAYLPVLVVPLSLSLCFLQTSKWQAPHFDLPPVYIAGGVVTAGGSEVVCSCGYPLVFYSCLIQAVITADPPRLCHSLLSLCSRPARICVYLVQPAFQAAARRHLYLVIFTFACLRPEIGMGCLGLNVIYIRLNLSCAQS